METGRNYCTNEKLLIYIFIKDFPSPKASEPIWSPANIKSLCTTRTLTPSPGAGVVTALGSLRADAESGSEHHQVTRRVYGPPADDRAEGAKSAGVLLTGPRVGQGQDSLG